VPVQLVNQIRGPRLRAAHQSRSATKSWRPREYLLADIARAESLRDARRTATTLARQRVLELEHGHRNARRRAAGRRRGTTSPDVGDAPLE